jgi:hypothetical protein
MQSILNSFIKTSLNEITNNYPWAINHDALPLEMNITQSSNYEENLQLKKELNRLFSEGDYKTKELIIRYYIVTWGGIKRNATSTIQSYVNTDPDTLIKSMYLKGIASWSKALCVREPFTYTIFDARVSASLNLLQLKHLDIEERNWFPRLPSRNSTVVKINSLISKQEGAQINKAKVYLEYLSLVNIAANYAGTDIQTVEMILFSKPIDLFNEYSNLNSSF